MAVFSAITADQLAALARAYRLPEVLCAEGIRDGVENTNYFLRAEGDPAPRWVLTLLEAPPAPAALAYILAVVDAAAAHGLPVPRPHTTRAGDHVLELDGRKALVTPKLPGRHPEAPGPAQCAAIGRFLGALHARVITEGSPRPDPRGARWLLRTARKLAPGSQPVSEALETLDRALPALSRLPHATCHGDLFRDNALFQGPVLSGVIDWYNAAHAPAAWDLAVVINDWCLDAGGVVETARARALLEGYQAERRLDGAEWEAMPVLRLWAALRFWTSRMQSRQAQATAPAAGAGAELYEGKDPAEQETIIARALEGGESSRWAALAAPA